MNDEGRNSNDQTKWKLDPSLKLTFCPRCDYSLQGLPEIGICPECGGAYNTDFIILRGSPVLFGEQPNGQRPRSIAIVVAQAACLALIPALIPFGMPRILICYLTVFVAACLCKSALIFLYSTRNRDVLVWLGPIGLREQPLIDSDSLPGKLVSRWSTIFNGIAFPSVFLLFAASSGALGIMVGIFLFILLLFPSYFFQLGQLPRTVLPAQGARPALLPWTSFGSIEIEELGNDTFLFWARQSKVIRKIDVIKIKFVASPQAAANLFHVIRHWAQSGIPVRMTRMEMTNRHRVARNAGLLVRNLFVRKK